MVFEELFLKNNGIDTAYEEEEIEVSEEFLLEVKKIIIQDFINYLTE